MGALPKRRISTHRKGRRRASLKASWPTLITCPHCGAQKRPHTQCPNCGKY